MSWYELLLTLHILAAALWIGSGLALTIVSYRLLGAEPEGYGPFVRQATWWAGRTHPAAAVVILLAGFAMIADADISMGSTWIVLGIVGWVLLMALGGGVIGRTADEIAERTREGATVTDVRPLASRLLLGMRVETALLILVVVDMVAKPGG